MKLNPNEFAYIIQENDESKKTELFILTLDPKHIINDVYTLTEEGLIGNKMAYLNRDMLPAVNACIYPLHDHVAIARSGVFGVTDQIECPTRPGLLQAGLVSRHSIPK